MRILVEKIASPCLRRHTAPSVQTGRRLRSSQGSKLDDVYRYYDGLFSTAGTSWDEDVKKFHDEQARGMINECQPIIG